MNYVTTNIRLPEEEWEYFKLRALAERKSLSSWVRDTLKKDIDKNTVFPVSQEFVAWTKKFIKKYKPVLEELAKK